MRDIKLQFECFDRYEKRCNDGLSAIPLAQSEGSAMGGVSSFERTQLDSAFLRSATLRCKSAEESLKGTWRLCMSIFSVFCSHCNLVLKSPILASSKSKPQARKTRRKRLTARQKNANAAKPASRPSNGTAKVVDLPLMNESTVHAAQKQHQPYVVGVAGKAPVLDGV